MQTREEEYLQVIKGYSKGELSDHFARAMGLLVNEMNDKEYADVLGQFYTESIATADQTARGEFFTPPEVSKLMARMTLDIEQIKAAGKPVTICEPCSGSGAIILACAEGLAPDHVDLMRVTMHDINPVACDMAYINTSLWGIPAEIILGNTLSMKFTARWTNIHWHRVGEEQRRKGLRMLDAIRELEKPADPKPAAVVANGSASTGPQDQLELF